MQSEIEVNGRIRQVSVERAGDRFAVSVDGRTWHVDARTPRRAHVVADRRARRLVTTSASCPTPRPAARAFGSAPRECRWRSTAAGGAAAPRGCGITARRGRSASSRRCPARSCACAVTPGEAVRARQTVVVIEAMKMENELRAARDGIVGELPRARRRARSRPASCWRSSGEVPGPPARALGCPLRPPRDHDRHRPARRGASSRR